MRFSATKGDSEIMEKIRTDSSVMDTCYAEKAIWPQREQYKPKYPFKLKYRSKMQEIQKNLDSTLCSDFVALEKKPLREKPQKVSATTHKYF